MQNSSSLLENQIANLAAAPRELPLVLCGSPRAGGNSEAAATLFAASMQESGVACRMELLRQYAITPCNGCGSCAVAAAKGTLFTPGQGWHPLLGCPLARHDGSAPLLQALLHAPWVCIAAPIYMYHLPAMAKGFLDRLQPFWSQYLAAEAAEAACGASPPLVAPWVGPPRPFFSILIAGRQRGAELFSGSLRTMRWALKPMGFTFASGLELRGVDGLHDLASQPETLRQVQEFATAVKASLAGGQDESHVPAGKTPKV